MTGATTSKLSLERKILNYLRRWGRGCVFSNSDFFSLSSDANVACALHHLKKRGTIRPLWRGLYDYPKYSKLLREHLAPDLRLVAAALARKYKWHIRPSGSAALNHWGLSTQIPTRLLYFSSGPNRFYAIGNRSIEFKHVPSKQSHLGDAQCELFIQAIKELGDLSLSDTYLPKIKSILTPELIRSLNKATPLLTEKLRSSIRTITASSANE